MKVVEMNKSCSYKIAWTTFIANLLIVIHHANLEDYFPDKVTVISSGIMNIFSTIAIPAMVWFFFISAFLFFRKFRIDQLLSKWRKRIWSLLIPFIIWNTVSVILNVLKGEEIFGNGILQFLIDNFMFIGGTGCANGPLWYLFRLMEYVVLVPLIYFVVKNRWLTLAVELIIILFNFKADVGYFGLTYFLPVYIFGAYLGQNKCIDFEDFLSGRKKSMNLAGLMLSIAALICMSYVVTMTSGLLQTIVRYVSVLTIFFLIHFVSVVENEPPALVRGGVCGYTAPTIYGFA